MLNSPTALVVCCVDDLKAALPDYDSDFIAKRSSPAEHFGAPPDGIAVFVRRTAFSLLRTVKGSYREGSGKFHN